MTDAKVKLAEAQAAAAKARLAATAAELQRRLRPDELARGAVEGLREKSAELAGEAVAAAKARPSAAAGAAAGLFALAFRKPIGRLARRLFSHRNENDAAEL
jgi:hypothetical protein